MASHEINIGDGAIHYGTRKFFADFSKEPHFTNVDVVKLDFKRQILRVSDINEGNFDLIMVGGGGSIDGFRNKHCGIALPLTLDNLEEINAPMLFWCLGHNLFRGQEWHVEAANRLNKLIEICRQHEWPFTVRADGSLARLESTLTPSNHDYVAELPDPGFFIETDKNFNPPTSPSQPYVLIQLASDNYFARIGEKEEIKAFFESMADYCDWLYERGYRIMFAVHTQPDIIAVSETISSMEKESVRFGVGYTGMYNLMNAHMFFRYYDNAALVVGVRGHAMICGAGLGKPVIAIDTHDKIYGFMKEIGQLNYCINPTQPDFPYSLKEISSDILGNGNYDFQPTIDKGNMWRTDMERFITKHYG